MYNNMHVRTSIQTYIRKKSLSLIDLQHVHILKNYYYCVHNNDSHINFVQLILIINNYTQKLQIIIIYYYSLFSYQMLIRTHSNVIRRSCFVVKDCTHQQLKTLRH